MTLDYLQAGDFTILRHREVFAALREASGASAPGAERQAWPDRVFDAAGPEIDREYLAWLQGACPDPAHGAVYGRLVLDAGVRRAIVVDAEDLDGQARSIGGSANRMFAAQVDGGRQVEVSADYAREVAGLLRRHASAFSPDTVTAAPGGLADPGDARGRAEERILAALLTRHPDARQVLDTVGPEAFTGPARREIFGTVRSLYRAGRGHEVDDLTVDWETALAKGPVPSYRDPGLLPDDDEPSYAARLATVPLPNRVVKLAQELARPARHPVQQARADGTLSPPSPSALRNGAGPVTHLIEPPPPLPGQGPGPVQGR